MPSLHPKCSYVVSVAALITILLILSYSHHAPISLLPQTYSYKAEIAALNEQEFPKKIWQSWKDDSEAPTEKTAGFSHRWRSLNTEYQYERITDANMDTYVSSRFTAPKYSKVLKTFSNLTDPIMRADMLRYMVMLVDGGVWADIDVLPHRPVEQWIPEDLKGERINMVIGIENDHDKNPIWPNSPYSVQLAQFTILVKPHHPTIATLVNQVADNLQDIAQQHGKEGVVHTFEDVMSKTGPFVFTDVMMKYFKEVTGVEHNGDELNKLEEPRLVGDVLVLPKDMFGWLEWEHTHEKEYMMVEHLFIGSWRPTHPGS